MGIIKANHTWYWELFFRYYTGRILKKQFHRIVVEMEDTRAAGPVLLIGNHFSWWDGFVAYYMNYSYFRRKFHVMMLREQLEKRMFLNGVGAFSVQQSGRSVIETINYTSSLLEKPGNIVLIYPQGHFESLHTSAFRFEKGIEKILHRCSSNPDILFMVTLVDFFAYRKPSLFIRTRRWEGERDLLSLQEGFNAFHAGSVARQNENLI